MTFLELVNRFRREAGISSSALATLSSLSGEDLRAKEWVQQAWNEIQMERQEWDWLRKSVSFAAVAQQQTYTTSDMSLTDFGAWVPESFRCYLTSIGTADEQFLSEYDYMTFRDLFVFSTFRTTYQRPTHVSVNPANHAILLGPTPDAIYTVVGEYFATPTELTNDSDEPACPSRYHMAVVYRAMMDYAAFEAASEVYQRGELKYNEMLHRMERDQLPAVCIGGTLA